MSTRIKSALWIQSQVRMCDIQCIPIFIRKKGDPDGGAIILKIERGGKGSSVYAQARTPEGKLAWMPGGGGEILTDEEAENYIKRQISFDPDLWVVEVEDPDGRYELDGECL